MDDDEIEVQLGVVSRYVATLIEEFQNLLEEDDVVCEKIHFSAKSMKFFLARNLKAGLYMKLGIVKKTLSAFSGLGMIRLSKTDINPIWGPTLLMIVRI